MDDKHVLIGIGVLAALALLSKPQTGMTGVSVKYATQNDNNVYPKAMGTRRIAWKMPTESAEEVFPKPIRPWDGGYKGNDFASSAEQALHGGNAIQGPSYWEAYDISKDPLHRHQFERRQNYPEWSVSPPVSGISRTSNARSGIPPGMPMPASYEEPYKMNGPKVFACSGEEQEEVECISKSSTQTSNAVYPKPFGGRSIAAGHGVPRGALLQPGLAGDRQFQYRSGFQHLDNVFGYDKPF